MPCSEWDHHQLVSPTVGYETALSPVHSQQQIRLPSITALSVSTKKGSVEIGRGPTHGGSEQDALYFAAGPATTSRISVWSFCVPAPCPKRNIPRHNASSQNNTLPDHQSPIWHCFQLVTLSSPPTHTHAGRLQDFFHRNLHLIETRRQTLFRWWVVQSILTFQRRFLIGCVALLGSVALSVGRGDGSMFDLVITRCIEQAQLANMNMGYACKSGCFDRLVNALVATLAVSPVKVSPFDVNFGSNHLLHLLVAFVWHQDEMVICLFRSSVPLGSNDATNFDNVQERFWNHVGMDRTLVRTNVGDRMLPVKGCIVLRPGRCVRTESHRWVRKVMPKRVCERVHLEAWLSIR